MGAEKAFVVSFRGAKMSIPPVVVVDCGRQLAGISSDNREMERDFGSSGVLRMKASGGWTALACRSLAWPTALDLYCVLVPPRAMASTESVMIFSGALDCGRVSYRGQGEAARS